MGIVYVSIWLMLLTGATVSDTSNIPLIEAKSASDFLNSIGVNTSVSKRGEKLDKTIEAISYTGIRWVRTGYEGDIPIDDLLMLTRHNGTRFSYGLLSGGTDIARLLGNARKLASVNALLAIEGPNEPNNWSIHWQGENGGGAHTWLPVAKLQRGLYAAVKKDSTLRNYPVWSLSENGAQTDNAGLQYLTIPYGSNALMPAGTRYADYANCHNYITHPSWPGLHDNQTWNAASPFKDSRMDGLYNNYGLTWAKKYDGYSETELAKLPRVTTETGLTIESGISEEKHAALITNMYLAQFKRGWSYTAVYLLRDRTDETGNQRFGFYEPDYTPRPAAHYLHNLTTILATEGRVSVRDKGVQYQIVNKPETVHDLLLERADGSMVLVIWGEKLHGKDAVRIQFDKSYKRLSVYDIATGTSATEVKANANELTLQLSDHAMVVCFDR